MTVTQWVDHFFKSKKIVCKFPIKKISICPLVEEKTINISPRTIGVCVDYLTRLILEGDFNSSFQTVRIGLFSFEQLNKKAFDKLVLLKLTKENFEAASLEFQEHKKLYKYWVESFKTQNSQITNTLIKDVIKLLKYDAFYRSAKLISNPEPDEITIEYIKSLVYISANYLTNKHKEIYYGGRISSRTEKITIGDWDYLSQDSLIDMKVSKNDPLLKNWIQLLVYYLLGLEVKDKKFLQIKWLEILNPKLSTVYRVNLKEIPEQLIQTIRTEYGKVIPN